MGDDYICSIGMALKILEHSTLQRHGLYGFLAASISLENLHHYYCMVMVVVVVSSIGINEQGKNATHIMYIFIVP